MDSDTNSFFQSIETENNSLRELNTNLETEVTHLNIQASDLEKALTKQKKFHRKFAEDAITAENSRVADFKQEKRGLIDDNKSLIKVNRQLSKDVDFYKKAHEELTKENETTDSAISYRKSPKTTRLAASASTSASTQLTSPALLPRATLPGSISNADCKHKSSKVLSKISEKLMLENKKLKSKMETLNATIRVLKTKNQRLEDFKQKVDKKKLKFSQDADELALLIDSTEQTNEEVFTLKILAELGELSRYKFPVSSEENFDHESIITPF